MPPPLPRDPFFPLAPTARRVTATSAAALGNRLVRFLQEEHAASAVKVRAEKFTVRAEVWHREASCAVKLRLYAAGGGEYLVELQRRRGDALAAAGVAGSLAGYLERGGSTTGPSRETAAPAPAAAGRAALEEEDLEPLLSLAEAAAQLPEELRAELAAAFAAAARSGGPAAELLCRPRQAAATRSFGRHSAPPPTFEPRRLRQSSAPRASVARPPVSCLGEPRQPRRSTLAQGEVRVAPPAAQEAPGYPARLRLCWSVRRSARGVRKP